MSARASERTLGVRDCVPGSQLCHGVISGPERTLGVRDACPGNQCVTCHH